MTKYKKPLEEIDRRLTFRIPAGLHDRLKILAIQQQKPLYRFLVDALEEVCQGRKIA